jgi:hypothetical protein
MSARLALLAAALLASWPALAADLPTPSLTPGKVRDGVTASDLCPTAHTAKIRNVPQSLKTQVYKRYGLKGNHTGYCKIKEGCEVDHLVSLELGGSNDIENLWPEPYSGTAWNAHVKDKLENTLHSMVCAGTVALGQAQYDISVDWIAAYRKYIGKP